MSTIRRFYIPGVSKTDRVEVEPAEARHITRVLRLGVGDELIAFDGSGCECLCRISEISGRRVTVEVIERNQLSREPDVEVTLAIAATRAAAMDTILRMCTELGVARIAAFECGRSVSRAGGGDSAKIEKWRRMTIEAAKQCGRNVLPELLLLRDSSELCELAAECEPTVVAEISPDARPLKEILAGHPAARRIMYIIGSEGGFAEQEVEAFAGCGILRASLGPTILRVETAAVAALAMIVNYYT